MMSLSKERQSKKLVLSLVFTLCQGLLYIVTTRPKAMMIICFHNKNLAIVYMF